MVNILNNLKFKTADEMQKKINKYFKDCEGKPLVVDGKSVFNKNGEPVITGKKPLTVTGLALALGMRSRQTLLNYQHKDDDFSKIIENAKLRIENFAEEQLYDSGSFKGAQFNLRNNYGWREELSVNSDINMNADIKHSIDGLKSMSDEELARIVSEDNDSE